MGSAFYGSIKVLGYVVSTALMGEKMLLKGYAKAGLTLYFIKYDGEVGGAEEREYRKKIFSIFSDKIHMVEFKPFNDKDVFGFNVRSHYYWWVSKDKNRNLKKQKGMYSIVCTDNFEKMSERMRNKISLYWRSSNSEG